MSNCLVSVWMITYNHEKYIAQALNGVLMQETNFNFEIVIGEDFSKDNTRAIIQEYESKYPTKIRIICQESNVGVLRNAYEFTLPLCKGKYIACLEGDDYWTDPLKLQKQVDFLEANPDYSLCSHRLQCYYQDSDEFKDDWMVELFKYNQTFVDIDIVNFFKVWVTQTVTVVFKKESYDINDYKKFGYYRDTHLFFNILQNGKGRVLNFYGAVYRIHEKGIWSNTSALFKQKLNLITSRELFNNYKSSFLEKAYYGTLRGYIYYSIRKGNTISEFNLLLKEAKKVGLDKKIFFKLYLVSLLTKLGLYFIVRFGYKISNRVKKNTSFATD